MVGKGRKNVSVVEKKAEEAKSIILENRYRLIKKAGKGGMASVYVAEDQFRNDKLVAIKILSKESKLKDDHVKRFYREMEAISRVKSNYSVQVYDTIEVDNTPVIIMEYIDDHKTLKMILNEEGALIEERAVFIICCVLKGLVDIHKRSVIHRDIKPHNIIVTYSNEVKLIDFGISKFEETTQLEITNTNDIVGSVYYLPPENLSDEKKKLSALSDIYSLGIVFYEALTNKLPFTGESAISIVKKHVDVRMPSVREINPDISRRIDAIISKATQKDPTKRYQSAEEMLKDLENYKDNMYTLIANDKSEIEEEDIFRIKDDIEISEYENGKSEVKKLFFISIILIVAIITIFIVMLYRIIMQ